MPALALGAVTYDTAGTPAYNTSSTTITATNTVSGGCTNPVLVAGVTWRGSVTITGAVATAGAMTDSGAGRVQAAGGSVDTFVQMFYRAGTTGAQSVTATFSSANDEAHLILFSACGVHQTTSIGTAVSGSDTYFTALTINATADVGGLIFDGFAIVYDSETFTAGAGQSQILNTFNGVNQILASYKTGAGSLSMTWNAASYGGYWAGIALPIKPAAGSAPAIRRQVVVVQ